MPVPNLQQGRVVNYAGLPVQQIMELAAQGDQQAQEVLDTIRSGAAPASLQSAQAGQERIVGAPQRPFDPNWAQRTLSGVMGEPSPAAAPGAELASTAGPPMPGGIAPGMHMGDTGMGAPPPQGPPIPAGQEAFQQALAGGPMMAQPPPATAGPGFDFPQVIPPQITPPTEKELSTMDKLFGKDKAEMWTDVMRFGLGMMKAGTAKPGSVRGPSFLGGLGEAGAGTLDRIARRKAGRAKTAATASEKEKDRQIKRDKNRYRSVPGVGLVEVGDDGPSVVMGKKPTGREQREQMLVDSGVPPKIAKGIASGRYAVSRDPMTQSAQVIDLSTGRVVFRDQSAPTPETETKQADRPGKTLFNMADEVTGVIPAVREGAQGITGQVGIDVASPELLENRQTFKTSQNELVRSLSINPRFPVGEINRIRKEINIEPGAFKDALTLKSRMRSVDASLRRRFVNETRAAQDKSLPAKTRQNAASAAKDIGNYLEILGVPQAGAQGTAGGVKFRVLER